VWDLGCHKGVRQLHGHSAAITSLCSTEGAAVASASLDGTVRVWLAPLQGCVCAHILKHSGLPLQCVVHAGFGRLVSAGVDKALHVWGVDGVCEQIIQGHSYPVTSLAMLANGNLVSGATGGEGALSDNTLRVWGSEICLH